MFARVIDMLRTTINRAIDTDVRHGILGNIH